MRKTRYEISAFWNSQDVLEQASKIGIKMTEKEARGFFDEVRDRLGEDMTVAGQEWIFDELLKMVKDKKRR